MYNDIYSRKSIAKYEVHQRTWNGGVAVALIFESDDLDECKRFLEKWNNTMDEIYEGTHVSDDCCYFAEIFNVEKEDYI